MLLLVGRMMTVLSRTPETDGQGWVVRITSANMAVLLVPSPIVPRGTPWRIWPADAVELVKIPAPVPVVPNWDVVPRQAK
jgi:hypothetical protein